MLGVLGGMWPRLCRGLGLGFRVQGFGPSLGFRVSTPQSPENLHTLNPEQKKTAYIWGFPKIGDPNIVP